jgi:protein phosphatase
MIIAAKTDIGNQRAENQDSFRAGYRPEDDTAWAVVCDGMGGVRGGRVASNVACASMEECLESEICYVKNEDDAFILLRCAVEVANAAVYKKAQETPSMRGMGTTVVCAIVRRGMAYYAHVGDSRVYLYHGHTLIQLTRDHSLVQQLLEEGKITEQEAATHPNKNLITRALGVGAQVEAVCGSIPVRTGDVLLLCTDGLSNYTTVDELEQCLAKCSPYEAVDEMIQCALDMGGLDNITVLLIKVETAEEKNG